MSNLAKNNANYNKGLLCNYDINPYLFAGLLLSKKNIQLYFLAF